MHLATSIDLVSMPVDDLFVAVEEASEARHLHGHPCVNATSAAKMNDLKRQLAAGVTITGYANGNMLVVGTPLRNARAMLMCGFAIQAGHRVAIYVAAPAEAEFVLNCLGAYATLTGLRVFTDADEALSWASEPDGATFSSSQQLASPAAKG